MHHYKIWHGGQYQISETGHDYFQCEIYFDHGVLQIVQNIGGKDVVIKAYASGAWLAVEKIEAPK